jgi:hypothetical protein
MNPHQVYGKMVMQKTTRVYTPEQQAQRNLRARALYAASAERRFKRKLRNTGLIVRGDNVYET